jgi:hypothetical protein
VRPKDTASTDAELALAMAAANEAIAWCESEGLVRPRLMMSGNGAQLWFALPPTALEGERRERLQAGLKAFETKVRERAQTDAVHVDSIHDVARIIKVIGTVSHKGDGQGDRPHRVSAALSGFDRVEDAALLARLDVEPEPTLPVAAPRVSLPVVGNVAAPGTTKAKRTPEGEYDWEHPVEMCGPVQRLWDHGAEDRSVAIFDMVRFFAHKGLGLDELTELVLEYDRRGWASCAVATAFAYIAKAHEKVLATARADGSIAPPCHSLQKIGFCKVNVEPGARCDLYDVVFDIEKAIEAVPADTPARELEYRLKPILDAIAHRDPSVQSKYLGAVEKRFGLKAKDLRKAVAKAATAPAREDGEGADPESSDEDMEGAIFEDASCYYCMTARGESKVISSFTIEPTTRVETEEGELILGYANTDKGGRVPNLRFPLSSFHSKRDLIRQLPSADLQWTGSDNNVQGLLRVLARRDVPRRPGSNMLGDYKKGEHHVWLGPAGAIGKEGFMDPAPVLYVPSGGSLDKRISYVDCDEDTFLEVASDGLQAPAAGEQARGDAAHPRLVLRDADEAALHGEGRHVPDALRLGHAGLGQVEPLHRHHVAALRRSRRRAVQRDRDGVRAPQAAHVDALGAGLHRRVQALRHAAPAAQHAAPLPAPPLPGRGRGARAPGPQGEQLPPPGAGLRRGRDAAPRRLRCSSASSPRTPTRRRSPRSPRLRHAYRELRAVDLVLFAPRYIQFCLGRDFDADLEVARAVAKALLGGRKVPVRVVENLTAMLLGIHLFEEFAKHCGCELPDDLGVPEAAVDAMLDDVLETDHGVKNALDHFLEMLGVMAVQGDLKHKVHYVFDEGRLAAPPRERLRRLPRCTASASTTRARWST